LGNYINATADCEMSQFYSLIVSSLMPEETIRMKEMKSDDSVTTQLGTASSAV